MYKDKNLVYILTILEAIEKIKIYSKNFENTDDFLWDNNQQNFNASVNLFNNNWRRNKKK